MSVDDPWLEAVLNLSRFHREHEEFYAEHPREQAVALQRHSRTFKALAGHWLARVGGHARPGVPYAGSEDLNDPVALQLDGVLFMEAGGRPALAPRPRRAGPGRTFTPDGLRGDLDGARSFPGLVFSATELLDRAADLLSDSAGLVHENERRWRVFRQRVAQLVSTGS